MSAPEIEKLDQVGPVGHEIYPSRLIQIARSVGNRMLLPFSVTKRLNLRFEDLLGDFNEPGSASDGSVIFGYDEMNLAVIETNRRQSFETRISDICTTIRELKGSDSRFFMQRIRTPIAIDGITEEPQGSIIYRYPGHDYGVLPPAIVRNELEFARDAWLGAFPKE